jgi:hypothetical protein
VAKRGSYELEPLREVFDDPAHAKANGREEPGLLYTAYHEILPYDLDARYGLELLRRLVEERRLWAQLADVFEQGTRCKS